MGIIKPEKVLKSLAQGEGEVELVLKISYPPFEPWDWMISKGPEEVGKNTGKNSFKRGELNECTFPGCRNYGV